MGNLNAGRYCIVMKKGRKIFNMIAGCLMMLWDTPATGISKNHASIISLIVPPGRFLRASWISLLFRYHTLQAVV